MKKLLLLPILFFFTSFVSNDTIKKDKTFCGFEMDFSNTNTFPVNLLAKVRVTNLSGGSDYFVAPMLYGDRQAQNVYEFGGQASFYNISIVYGTENTTNYGYVYLADPDNNIIQCQAAVPGGQNIIFYNIFLTCTFGGNYHIGVRDTPC